MKAGPMLRTRRLEKVPALMGSSDAPPRLPPCAGSSCARIGREKHKRSGNSLMDAEYIAWQGGGGGGDLDAAFTSRVWTSFADDEARRKAHEQKADEKEGTYN